MIVAVDFDGVMVEQGPYDATTPLVLRRDSSGIDSRQMLAALKAAGHRVLIYSARANRALRFNPDLDPLGVAGRRHPDRDLEQDRYRAMVEFCGRELGGLYDAIDDGAQGKPEADLYLDDRAARVGGGPGGLSLWDVARIFGEPADRPSLLRFR